MKLTKAQYLQIGDFQTERDTFLRRQKRDWDQIAYWLLIAAFSGWVVGLLTFGWLEVLR